MQMNAGEYRLNWRETVGKNRAGLSLRGWLSFDRRFGARVGSNNCRGWSNLTGGGRRVSWEAFAVGLGLGIKLSSGSRFLNVETIKWHFTIFLGLTLSVFGNAFFDNTLKEAKNGYADAQFNLGVMYATGEGVPKDDVEAGKWYRKTAEQGYARAQCNLGVG